MDLWAQLFSWVVLSKEWDGRPSVKCFKRHAVTVTKKRGMWLSHGPATRDDEESISRGVSGPRRFARWLWGLKNVESGPD